MSRTARRAHVDITYQGKNITKDIAPYLKEFEFADGKSGDADSIQFTLQDREGQWLSGWKPTKGDVVEAGIIVEDWFGPGHSMTLPCGSFQVDDFEMDGPPKTVKIKAVSVPVTSSLRGDKKTKGWERITLRDMASDIAASAGLDLVYEADLNPYYLRVDQPDMSDLAFLLKQCQKSGLSMKVTDQQIVIFDERKYEAKESVRTIDLIGGDVEKYHFGSKSSGTAKSAKVTYTDPLTGKKKTGIFTDPNSKSGVTIENNECPEDEDFDEDYDDDEEE